MDISDSQFTLNLFNNADLLMGIKIVVNQVNRYTYTGIRLTKIDIPPDPI